MTRQERSNNSVTLRLGTRGSMLARVQSQWVADELERFHPAMRVELVIVRTSGDRLVNQSLADSGGKGLFTKELEEALLRDEIDLAVHSYKDVPVTMPLVDQLQFVIAAVPPRIDPRDVLISKGRLTLEQLPRNARVGTSSLRRSCQLLNQRPDLNIQPLRGNIDTRLKKLCNGEFDAIVLAAAGLRRSGMFDDRIAVPLAESDVIPSAGQGALAIQCRRDDGRTIALAAVLDDEPTRLCVELERAVVAALDGDCHSPIGARARIVGDTIELFAVVGAQNGLPPIVRARAIGPVDRATQVLELVLSELGSECEERKELLNAS